MAVLREHDLADRRPPMLSLPTTLGGTIVAVYSRCRSRRNFAMDRRLKLSDSERAAPAEIGHRLGRKVLTKVATVARARTQSWPVTRKLVACKFDGSNHQGKDNVLLFPRNADTRSDGPVQCCERLGGMLRYYRQAA
jgi:hypothetical protein